MEESYGSTQSNTKGHCSIVNIVYKKVSEMDQYVSNWSRIGTPIGNLWTVVTTEACDLTLAKSQIGRIFLHWIMMRVHLNESWESADSENVWYYIVTTILSP